MAFPHSCDRNEISPAQLSFLVWISFPGRQFHLRNQTLHGDFFLHEICFSCNLPFPNDKVTRKIREADFSDLADGSLPVCGASGCREAFMCDLSSGYVAVRSTPAHITRVIAAKPLATLSPSQQTLKISGQ